MTCEIYRSLIATGLLQVNKQPECVYESTCPQTCEDCIYGKIIIEADKLSEDAAITDEDRAQARELAKLEAECSARSAASINRIKAHNESRTRTSTSRVN